jgi:hypothetical protein
MEHNHTLSIVNMHSRYLFGVSSYHEKTFHEGKQKIKLIENWDKVNYTNSRKKLYILRSRYDKMKISLAKLYKLKEFKVLKRINFFSFKGVINLYYKT